MIGSRWYKVFFDLWGNKTRTLLIVLSIAVGLFAVGTIASARTILSTGMAASFAEINPSTGIVRTVELFGEEFVRSVRSMDEVADADARRILQARIEVGPDEWADINIFAVDDYDRMRVNKIWPERGSWPPPDKEILIERAALPVIHAQIGDTVTIETADKKTRTLRIAGTVHDLVQVPAEIDGTPYGYISMPTLDWLGEAYGFNELAVVAKHADNKEVAKQVTNLVKDRAERIGLTIPVSLTAEPGQLPLGDILQSILLLMGILGVLALFLSAFLIINTVTALLAQQQRQIGVMKAIGAGTRQIMGMYLVMVTVYGLLALLLSLPLSIWGSRLLSGLLASVFNFDVTDAHIPPGALILQIAVGLVTPLLASLAPLFANTRITAARAMSIYTTGNGRFGAGGLDRLISGETLWFARRILPRPFLLSLRNIFRNKGRLVMTLITLTLGGAIFIGVFGVNASLDNVIKDLMRVYNFDAMIVFARPYRTDRIGQAALAMPGIVAVDTWIQLPVRHVRPDGSESDMIYMFAPHPGSPLVPGPRIVEGRWLLPDDGNAVVVDAIIRKDAPDLKVGDTIILKIDGREHPFRIVGFSLGIVYPVAYAPYSSIARITGRVGRADAALVATAQHEAGMVEATMVSLQTRLERNSLRVNTVQTIAGERAEAGVFFAAIIALLMFMAVLLAVVGGLGLMGTMTINVLERTREIGVLRAIGAPNRGVAEVFMREGIAIGLISWLLGALLAFPLGKLLANGVGLPILGVPLNFVYSMTGAWIWLVIVTVLSALACFFPARNASRLTVREVLAYE